MDEAKTKAELRLTSLLNEAARIGKTFLELGQALEADPFSMQAREGFILTRQRGARVNGGDLDPEALGELIREIQAAKAEVDRLS